MSYKTVLLLLFTSIAVVACGLLTVSSGQPNNKDKQVVEREKSAKFMYNNENFNAQEQAEPEPPPERSKKDEAKEVLTHYDSESLDAAVRAEALLLGKDPEKYHMLVRSDTDGTKIYRTIGMHVTERPNGEKYYLPDQI